MSESDLEAIVKRFVALAGMPILSKAEHEEARNLMRDLKTAGMSNQEISNLSGGRWSESSVKGYTKHVRPADTAVWQNVVDLLRNLIANDMPIEEVRKLQELATALNKRGVSIDDVADFLQAADSASIDVGCLIQKLRGLNDEGVTPRAITEVVTLKEQLEENGFTLDSLPALAKLAKTHGAADKVLDAVYAYGSLSEIENQKKTADHELRQMEDKKTAAQHELAETKQKLAQERIPLQSYQKVRDLGFDEKALVQLANVAEKHGGVKPFLKAMGAHGEYAAIMKDIQQAKSQRASLQTAIETLDAKHSHRRTAVEMCEKLLTEYGLGLDAIGTMLAMARKHGEPSIVMKAMEGYGSLQGMIQIEHQLDGRIKEKKSLLAELEGRCQAAMGMVDTLNAKCIAAGTEVARLENRLTESKVLRLVTTLINDPASATFNEHAPTALAMAAGLRKFAEGHQRNFPNSYTIKSGLDAFVRDLGG